VLANEPCEEQGVLRRDFAGGASGGSRADLIRLDYDYLPALALKQQRSRKASDPGSYDDDIGRYSIGEGLIPGTVIGEPDRFSFRHPHCLSRSNA
jgi:hypothetical protein